MHSLPRSYDRTYRPRSWTGCLYVPAFEAWALERASPGRGPVVALAGGRAVAWSRVPALREVRPGDGADRIARLCPDARIRVRDTSVEWACWEGVVDALHRLTPFIVPSRPPWVWFAADAMEDLRTLAADLGVRVGVAADRTTARLAAVRTADGHVLGVTPGRRRAFLDRFGVDLLQDLGFPDWIPERLRLFGYPTLGAIAPVTGRQLRAQFGPEGEELHALLRPSSDGPIPLHVPPPAVEVVDEPEGSVSDGPLEAVVGRLVRRAADTLGDRRTQRIVLEVDGDAGTRRRASRLLPGPHWRVDALTRFVLRLLPEVMRPGEAACRIAVRLEALRRPDVTQVDLFDARPAVTGAVRRVHRRYPGMIRRAVIRPDALMPEDEVVLEVVGDGAAEAA